MLPKKNRIVKDADFGTICRYGRSFSLGKLVLKVKENNLGFVRLGVSVGLKFSLKAVTRNRIKRELRAFFFRELEKIKGGQDFIVIVNKGWNEKTDPILELKQILIKNLLFKE
jgi:ribonuclease P protein component